MLRCFDDEKYSGEIKALAEKSKTVMQFNWMSEIIANKLIITKFDKIYISVKQQSKLNISKKKNSAFKLKFFCLLSFFF